MVNAASRPVVYIVEDDQSVRDGLTRLMRSADLPVCAYADAESFLNEISAQSQGCVLLDMTMPRLNGLEVQARLKARHIDIPVIAVSAREDDETRTLARELGAQFFMRKPVDDQALLDAISWVLDKNYRRV